MSYHFYLLMHLLGIATLFFALGGSFLHGINGGTKDTNEWRKPLMAMHGIALLLILTGGFGMLARLSMSPEHLWVVLKLVIWILLGVSLIIPRRFPKLARPTWCVLPLLVVLAGWLAYAKPG